MSIFCHVLKLVSGSGHVIAKSEDLSALAAFRVLAVLKECLFPEWR
ncbi:hypothetical protein QFZ79_003401 [Arthrobacter sp. V4I6]|nr:MULTISPECIES: hypothetical protein [unclassified Arthrobacter]MDQ0821029.1 hypothetical protein [Arthrobacter sp. V1I7]MDQ0855290.1 hypothetical protein [Arthrobacter sp. V4I6]